MKSKIILKILLFSVIVLSIYSCNNERNVIRLNSGELKIIPYTNRSAQIVFTPKGEKYPMKENLTITKNPEKIKVIRKNNGDTITLSWGMIKFSVNKKTGQICYYKMNELLFKDVEVKSFSYKKTELNNEPLYSIEKKINISHSQGLYGLGQYLDGVVNLQDHEALIVQANKISVNPLLVSTSGYGILWDNYSKTQYKNIKGLTSFSSEYAAVISYFVIVGQNMDDVIKGYRELTGDAPLFDKRAYGYWQSKERYKSFQELIEVVDEYRARKIPIDNIVQDWKYWGENTHWSSMEFDSITYPNAKENIKKLHDRNVQLMVSIWPGLGAESDIFKKLDEKGYLYGNFWAHKGAKVYDTYAKEARDIYWNQIKNGLIDYGVDALWMDGTEPEFSHTDDQQTTEKEIVKCISPSVGPLARYLNTFSLVTTSGIYEGQRSVRNKRVFTLTRSAFSGQQRNAAVTWTGDVVGRWDVLRNHIAGGINFSMSGIPYWSHDIGGFFVNRRGGQYPDGCKDPCYRELYTRWFQFGAFSPIFRSHGTDTPREVWQFGDEGEMFYEALKKTSELRYRLLPYIYSMAWKITSEGYSLMRAIPMDFPADTCTYNINDQYLFGESLLIKPVTHPMYYDINSIHKDKKIESEKSVEVYLPSGTNWYDFWSGEKYEGGQKINIAAPIDVIPIFVKAGTILPFGPSIQYVDEKSSSEMSLLIFPGADGNFTLYEDDGETYNYEKGFWSTISIEWDDHEKKLTIQKPQGEYKGMLTKRKFMVHIVDEKIGNLMQVKNGKVIDYLGEKCQVKF